MTASQALLFVCITLAFDSSCAKIPYDEIDPIYIFDNSSSGFEHRTIASTRMVSDFFARDDVSLVISTGMVAMQFAPYVKEFARIIPLIREMLEDKSGWRSEFAKAISEETMRTVAESEINW